MNKFFMMVFTAIFVSLRASAMNIDVFMDTCTVLNDTLAWDINKNRDNTACLDIDPDTLYELPYVKEQIA